MHGKKLMELARMVGLSQSDIARFLGVDRVQPHAWARGKRPIPRATLGPLMRCIHGAVERYLAQGRGDVGVFSGMRQEERGLAAVLFDPPPRPRIEALLWECIIENMELRGVGPSTWIQGAAVALEKYQTMDSASVRKPENAEPLRQLGAEISTYADMLLTLSPLFDLATAPTTEDTDHADDPQQSADPGSDSGANARH